MPKLKTHKGMTKRIKTTGTGKLMRRKSWRGHMFSKKSAASKRSMVKEFEVSSGDTQNIKRMLGM